MKKVDFDITNFTDARSLIATSFQLKKSRNPKFSLRAWARQLGYKNPSLLSDIICGRRSPSRDFLMKLSSHLMLSQDVQKRLLESASRATSRVRRRELTSSTFKLDLDDFRLIAEWYHLAILELFDLKTFKPDPRWIARHLCKPVSVNLIQDALDRLQRLGFVVRDEYGSLKKSPMADAYFIGRRQSNEAIRMHHSQTVSMALETLTQSLDARDFSGTTFAIRREAAESVRKEIYRFHKRLLTLQAPAGDGDEVLRVNVQMFRLDKNDNFEEEGNDNF